MTDNYTVWHQEYNRTNYEDIQGTALSNNLLNIAELCVKINGCQIDGSLLKQKSVKRFDCKHQMTMDINYTVKL